jgi:AraC-like DNA-binding protein
MGHKSLLAEQEGATSAMTVSGEGFGGAADAGAAAQAERVTLRRPPHLTGVELWSVGASRRLWTMFHTNFAFCTAGRVDGRRSVWHRGRAYEVGGSTTLLFEPGELQVTTAATGPADFHVLLVSAAVVTEQLSQAGAAPPALHFESGVLEDPAAAAQLRRLARALEMPVGDPVEQRNLLQRYLALAFTRGGEPTPPAPVTGCARAVDRTREILEIGYAKRITLDDCARETGLSKFHLERSFHDRVGVPIHQYLKKVRVAHACNLLRTGLRPAEIATRVGFADQPHMTRVFRDELGVTPKRLNSAGQPWPNVEPLGEC